MTPAQDYENEMWEFVEVWLPPEYYGNGTREDEEPLLRGKVVRSLDEAFALMLPGLPLVNRQERRRRRKVRYRNAQ